MRIYARDLVDGDVLQLNDWQLQVKAVDRGVKIAVTTTEFDCYLHFQHDDLVQVQRVAAAA
jgi:hypothetical protein